MKQLNHDSLPTNKLVLANLSLVLISTRQDTPISSITIRKMATKSPDSTLGVMFVKSLLFAELGSDVCSKILLWLLALLVK